MKSLLSLSACAVLSLFGLSACATTDAAIAPADPAGTCDASGVQSLVGQRATADLGTRLLRETGANVLRWVPPNTAVTMDYRFDRLTVSYDSGMIIERISCG